MAERDTENSVLLRRALASDRPEDASVAHPDDAAFERYLSRRLSDEEAASFERHFARCAECAEELMAANRVEVEAAEQLRVSPAPWQQGRARTRGRSWWRLAAGAVFVVGVSLAVGAGSRIAARRLEPLVLSGLTELSRREVSAKGAALVLASGPGFELEDLRVSDDPRFSSEDFFRVVNATLSFEPGALLRGQLRGRVLLTDPVLRLVRGQAGDWNIETVGKRSSTRRDLDGDGGEPAVGARPSSERPSSDERERRFELASATVRNGTLEIAHPERGKSPLSIRGVDLSYESHARSAGTVALQGRLPGQESNAIALRGEIGPFGTGDTPRYRLESVSLSHVPLMSIPGAPESLRGELSFTGNLDSSGRSLDAVVQAARGGGELAICCGALTGRNLIADVVSRLGQLEQDPARGAKAALDQARRQGAFADLLADGITAFAELGGHVDLSDGTLRFANVALDAGPLQATAAGTLAQPGSLAAAGEARLSRELSDIVLGAVPQARPLLAPDQTFQVPFRVAGVWPDVEITLDAERLLAWLDRSRQLVAGTRYSLFAFARLLPKSLGIG
jgi:hypothetical protein